MDNTEGRSSPRNYTGSRSPSGAVRIKFGDDTSALEIIPRNSVSVLNTAVSDIHNFAVARNMKLNPIKCKEMLINFLHNSDVLPRPVTIGDNAIERVTSYRPSKSIA